MPPARLPLKGVLSLALPSAEQDLLLRSALWPPERARQSLLAWQAKTPHPTAALARHPGGGRHLAPHIGRVIAGDAGGLDGRLLTYLRTAAVREAARGDEFRRIYANVLLALTEAEVPVLPVLGAALSELFYPDPRLRHSAAIDLLLRVEDIPRAAGIVERIGFRAADERGPDRIRHQVHESGLPLVLHRGLFRYRHYNLPQTEMWERAESREILGTAVKVLIPEDQLFHVCVHAMTGGHRADLLWVCDAWLVLERTPEIDWDLVGATAVRAHAVLPLAITLNYLARAMEAPIPGRVVERLQTAAANQPRFTLDLALLGAWTGAGSKIVPSLRRAESWRDRATVIRWRLAPSPEALLSAARITSKWEYPFFCLARPVRLAARGARWLVGGDARPPRTPA
ncbi:MAG TPA: nucleotidyltransferase family protein [Gemmatimonadota bacterium]|nr:nucleotidyltransferase family protein [Gemmatimonadota bacterium]